MKTSAVILARLDSSRLPGKALLPLAGMPIIEHVLRRMERCGVFDSIVLATTGRSVDLPLAEFFASAGGLVYRGADDEVNNVAKRFVSAAKSVGAEFALRVNGDSPFPDPGLIRQGVNLLNSSTDLVTNLVDRTYPYGVSAELVRVACLEEQLPSLSEKEKEHVTACFYGHLDRFQIRSTADCPWPPCKLRLTVDEPGDIAVLEEVLSQLTVLPTEADLLSIIEAAKGA
jgi:spore coat polysaccharide biosynthesis protein SpsF